MTIHEIAKLYLHGKDLKRQAQQLSNRSLSAKFERNPHTIARIANGMPSKVPEDEQRLIRECIAERDRLKSLAANLDMPSICKAQGVSHHTVENELIRMGEWEVST